MYSSGPSKYYHNDSAGFDDEYDPRDRHVGSSRREYRPRDEEEYYGASLSLATPRKVQT